MKIDWISKMGISSDMIKTMEKTAQECSIIEGIHVPCIVSVKMCNDEEILSINSKYRGIQSSTDVLSFPTVRFPAGCTAGQCEDLIRKEFDDELNACFLGDIFISVPHIISQANEFGHPVEREANYLLAHGICHLMGYDHIIDEGRKQMRIIEEKILTASDNARPSEH